MTHLTPISQPNIYFDFDRLTHQKSPLIGWKSSLIFLELSCSNLVANECLRDNVFHRGIIRNSLHMMRFCTVRRFCISYVIWSTPCMIQDGKKEVATEVGGGYRMKTFVTNKWGGVGRKSAQDTSFLRWTKKQITGFVESYQKSSIFCKRKRQLSKKVSLNLLPSDSMAIGNLRSYDGNCHENVKLKLNFALSEVIYDYSMLITLYKIRKLHFR